MNKIKKILVCAIIVIVGILVIYLVVVTIMSFQRRSERARTDAAINYINSKRITLDDVMGKNLPLEPDQNLNDSTIAGIDANRNSIRDDVELAIFKKYPDSAKIRAAELQYAQALQLELTQVFNSVTLVATIKKEDKASLCIGETGPDISSEKDHEKIIAGLAIGENRMKEVDDLMVNTDIRKKEQTDILNKYLTTYSVLPGERCDINLSSLPN